MFFRKLFGLIFLGLLIFGLLSLFGRGPGRYESAYRQGFIDGQQAASGEAAPQKAEEAPKADPDGGTQIYYRGRDFFFPGQSFLLCLVPMAALFFIFMSSAKRRHRGHWHHHKGGWGPCGPWKDWDNGPKEKSPDDIDDGPPEPAMQA